jgi:NAD(P)-dependent dehydrogenase (short-subunit alcohol dehydrogenase family)
MKRKTILITGTSSGIGNATAQYFAERDWNVAATVRRKKDFFLDSSSQGRNFLLDVSDKVQCHNVVNDAIAVFGGLDALVNNAGLSTMGAFEETSDEAIRDQLQTNVFGVMNMTREVLPHFRQQRSGVIIGISSVAGRIGIPLYSVHAATKFAIEGFLESLRFELNPFNVRVKIVEPGSYRSNIISNGERYERVPVDGLYESFVTKHREELAKHDDKRRDPVEVARVIWDAANDPSNQLRYLAGQDAAYMDQMRKASSDEDLFNFFGKNYAPSEEAPVRNSGHRH